MSHLKEIKKSDSYVLYKVLKVEKSKQVTVGKFLFKHVYITFSFFLFDFPKK